MIYDWKPHAVRFFPYSTMRDVVKDKTEIFRHEGWHDTPAFPPSIVELRAALLAGFDERDDNKIGFLVQIEGQYFIYYFKDLSFAIFFVPVEEGDRLKAEVCK